MKKEICLNEVQEYAEKLYRGGLSCSESLVGSIRDYFELEIPREVIAMGSGFSAGIGKTGCVCGALAGGIMALGILFGRTKPTEDVSKNHQLAKELHDYFKEATGKNEVCCRNLTRGFDMTRGEHKPQCTEYVGLVARKVAEFIACEHQLVIKD